MSNIIFSLHGKKVIFSHIRYFFLDCFWVMFGDAQSLLLALCSELYHGRTWGTLYGARDLTEVNCVPDKYLAQCTILIPLLFFKVDSNQNAS